MNSLTSEQTAVIHTLLAEKNVFLTGGGGVGKSYLISMIYSWFPGMKRNITKGKLPRIQLCALTGCAALLLGHQAKTLHSWAGVGLGKGTVAELYAKIRKNARAYRNWMNTDVLIIDEISMMTAELFDKLCELGKKIRRSPKPFGGIQLLLVGDFYQLPPVMKGDASSDGKVFAFESDGWKACELINIELTIIQRQKDAVFHMVLKEARVGALSKESCALLRAGMKKSWKDCKIRPTLLFPRRTEVEMVNEANVKALIGKRHTYKARLVYNGKMPDGFLESDEGFQRALASFDTNSPYAVDLELILHAQVMLIANVDPEAGLVNGSRGIIVGFCEATEMPFVEFVNGAKKPVGTYTWPMEDYEFVSRTQIPLRLAYATTIHRSQGSSLDAALVDIGSSNFEYGQAYVALSRARSLDALYIHDFDPIAFKAHPKVKAFYKDMIVTEEKFELDLDSLLHKIEEIEEKEEKSVYSEPLLPIQAIHVIKEIEPIIKDQEKEDLSGAQKEPGAQINFLFNTIPSPWKDILQPFEAKLLEMSTTLESRDFFPSREQIWSSFIPLDQIRVVILGQDPYPTRGNAHGLAFSTLSQPIPASLRNIYKELQTDIGCPMPVHGNLQKWVDQGVMLLNTILTVEEGVPLSHAKLGWNLITDHMIRVIAEKTDHTIFVLWGKPAQAKEKLILPGKHLILTAAHPSPLSAQRGFFGAKPFSRINEALLAQGGPVIDWMIE